MPAIAIAPASGIGGTTFTVSGSGFGKGQRLKMTVDGVGSTTNRFRAERNGTFVVGVTTGTSSALGTHTVKILADSNSALLASGTFQVVAVPVEPPPVEPPPTGTRVTSIAQLLSVLADNSVTDIVVANGTYRVGTNQLWIGEAFASRTNPVSVRAETKGGVIIDGGSSAVTGLVFVAGAHHQTWDGFTFANMTPTLAGVIMIGGYDSQAAKPSPHHITLRNITGVTNIVGSGSTAHMVYIGHPTPSDILLEDFNVKGAGTAGITALHSYHDPNAKNVTARRWTVRDVYRGMLLWSDMTGFLAEDWTITNAGHSVDIQGVTGTLRRITATSSGAPIIPSSITQENCSWGGTTPPVTVTVKTIAELYTALANNEPDITLAPGSYSGTIDINSRFAARTKPGVIHCDGVTINGGGLNHHGGVHDLDWVGGITFANWTLSQTGVMCFGGWDEPAAHHITIRKPKVLSSCRRASIDHSTEHGVYFSHARGGCHDILIEDLDVDASKAMGLSSAVHAYHADGGLLNAYNVTIRRMKYVGNRGLGEPTVQQAIIMWVPQHDWLIDGGTITNSNSLAVRFESSPASNIVLKDVTSANSGGFYSSMGANPPGVTFQNCSLG